jgi:hypothetical protein
LRNTGEANGNASETIFGRDALEHSACIVSPIAGHDAVQLI